MIRNPWAAAGAALHFPSVPKTVCPISGTRGLRRRWKSVMRHQWPSVGRTRLCTLLIRSQRAKELILGSIAPRARAPRALWFLSAPCPPLSVSSSGTIRAEPHLTMMAGGPCVGTSSQASQNAAPAPARRPPSTEADNDQLLFASLQADVWRVRTLVAAGADVNCALLTRLEEGHRRKHLDVGSTPLHLTCGGASHWEDEPDRAAWAGRMRHRVEVARLLVASGADTAARTAEGETPLHLCAALHRVDLVRILLSADPPPIVDARNRAGQTPLACACGAESLLSAHAGVFRVDTVRALLAAGADPNAVRLSVFAAAIEAPPASAAAGQRSPLDEPGPLMPAAARGFSATDAADTIEALLRCGYRLVPDEQALLAEQWGPQSTLSAVSALYSSRPESDPDRVAAERVRGLVTDPPAPSLFWPWVGLPDGDGWSPSTHDAFVKARGVCPRILSL